jgi:hypothetical protein
MLQKFRYAHLKRKLLLPESTVAAAGRELNDAGIGKG